ncbi:hypothetical protein D910_04624 [Dendroctonus ponderosae]|uniref:Rhodanese domain-containing protein n=1 Tax=Dendroctonus ponderosae TaxID=77166 RepID=U4U9D7_DENPD|nr:hypothetical protein D910_04624 [Dendroctonus ponderosae]
MLMSSKICKHLKLVIYLSLVTNFLNIVLITSLINIMFHKCLVRAITQTFGGSKNFQNANICKIRGPACGSDRFRDFSSSNTAIQPDKLEKVRFDEFKKLLKNEKVVVIDVREPQELVEHGALPRALNIPLDEVETALKTLPNEQFLKKYGGPKPDADSPIVFSCMKGMRSEKAQIAALQLDYKKGSTRLSIWEVFASTIETAKIDTTSLTRSCGLM